MSKLDGKIEYVKGLLEGSNFQEDDKNYKIIKSLIEVLEEVNTEVKSLSKNTEELEFRVEDLESLCEEETEDYELEIECPHCKETIELDDLINEEDEENFKIICPKCNNEIECVWDYEGACGCGCECGDDCEDDCECDENCDCKESDK